MISHFWPSPRPNPPWSNDILTSQWDQILAAGGPEWMPKHTKARTRIKAEEFGTGHYGVVMPTMTPGVVMKLTSDKTEADFVSWVLREKFGKDRPGLIPYLKIAQIHGVKKSNREVFVLWRAEAEKVGEAFVTYKHPDAYVRHASNVAADRLADFKRVAHGVKVGLSKSKMSPREAFDGMDRWRGEIDLDLIGHHPMSLKGVQRISFLLESARVVAEMMANEPFATEVGQTLLDLLEDHGILLADVHQGNIGMYKPEEYDRPIPVITDPGHAVFLK